MTIRLNSIQQSTDEFSLRTLLDNASDAVSRFDSKLRHVYANLATAKANNRRPEDFYGKTMRELGHSEEISDLIERNLTAVFESGEERTFDVEFHGPWGTKYFQTRMTPEKSEDGRTHHVISVSRDLTTEQHARRKVIESERFAAASRLAHELAHQLNNPLQALRNTLYLLEHEDEVADRKSRLQLADKLLERVETMLRTILLLREDDLGKHHGNDLTASIERVRDTFEASQKLLALAEGTEFPMLAIDMDGVITIWNAAAARIYGWTAAEALGKHAIEVTAKGQDEQLAEILRKVKAGEPIAPVDTERTRKDGTKVHMRLYISAILDINGEPVGVSSIGAVRPE